MNKQLVQKVASRNRIFGDMAPSINLNLSINLAGLKEKLAEPKQEPEKALKRNPAAFAKLLADKIREEPLYIKSNHPGGG